MVSAKGKRAVRERAAEAEASLAAMRNRRCDGQRAEDALFRKLGEARARFACGLGREPEAAQKRALGLGADLMQASLDIPP